MSAPTISDVARVAGVGKTSVSRYLNGETAALSADLTKRIESAISTLSYRPNQMARGLKRGRTRLIGLLVADLQNPYSVAVVQGIEAACRDLGLMPMMCNAGNELQLQNRYLDLLRTYRAEGLIINPVGLPESALHSIGHGDIPVVLLDRKVEGVHCDSVGLDNEGACRTLVDHLVAGQFNSLFFISESFASVSSRREREAAFVERAALHGVDARTLMIDLAEPTSIAAALDQVAAQASRARTALIAANGHSMLALAVALAARPIPGLGVASFDDPDWAPLTSPGITTLRQPTYDIGFSAVRYLNERIDGNKAPPRVQTFDAQLIVRSSTAQKVS